MRLYLSIMLFLFGMNCALQADEPDIFYEERLEESAVNIKHSEGEKAYKNDDGEIIYRSEFMGKEFCVHIVPPDPLDSFDIGASYVYLCD